MASIDDFAPPSSSLKAADLEGSEWTLTIKSYEAKEFEQTDNKTGRKYNQTKPILSFHETEKTLVANKTNLNSIAYAYGKEMDDWIGKQVTLFPTMVEFGGNMVEAIRVRVVKAATSKPKFLKNGPQDDHPFAPGNDEAPPF